MTATPYNPVQPSRSSIDELRGPAVIEFGTDWCGYCQGAQPLIAAALSTHADLTHLKFEDGKGRPLGRTFAVKLWPTLIFLRDGQEVSRVVRPGSKDEIETALSQIV